MRILCLFLSLAVAANGMSVRAEDRKFPYEAVVDAEQGEYVLSGPGAKYYPTQKLKNGERVMIHRHDPGGWCMIAPPRGSFSWVRASHVEREGDGGWIKTNRVVVHSGSTTNPEEYTTIQADLSKGDAVQILGEKEFRFDDGPRLMLKISPVKGEWRWIARKSIVASDAYRSSPFQEEQAAPKKRGGPIADGDAFAQPVSTGSLMPDGPADLGSDDNAGLRADQEQPSGKERLNVIDQQFREMIKQDPPTWDLEALETQYRQLDEELGQKAISTAIGLRLDAVKRYRKIHRDYVDFYKITSETRQRDAELMLQQTQFQSQLDNPNQVPGPSPAGADPQLMAQSITPQPVIPATQASSAQQMNAQQVNQQQFDGAGIVQRMAKTFPGGPEFVLISPEGRMLSFLQPAPGIDLNRFNGRSVGVVGQRVHRNDWNADVIAVRSLQPVQLRAAR
jgi:hypothetical protein